MARIRIAVLAALALHAAFTGCAMTWDGPVPVVQTRWGAPVEHRPAIEAELSPRRARSNYASTWSPDETIVERGILESVKDGPPPRDDSPSWLGPDRTAWAIVNGDRPGTSSTKELATRRQELDELRAKHAAEDKKGPEPRPVDLDRAGSAWEEWKAEHGVPPIDVSPPAPRPPTDRKGP